MRRKSDSTQKNVPHLVTHHCPRIIDSSALPQFKNELWKCDISRFCRINIQWNQKSISSQWSLSDVIINILHSGVFSQWQKNIMTRTKKVFNNGHLVKKYVLQTLLLLVFGGYSHQLWSAIWGMRWNIRSFRYWQRGKGPKVTVCVLRPRFFSPHWWGVSHLAQVQFQLEKEQTCTPTSLS